MFENIENSNSDESKKFSPIGPALKYLKEHIYDCLLKADKLHRLCEMSDFIIDCGRECHVF